MNKEDTESAILNCTPQEFQELTISISIYKDLNNVLLSISYLHEQELVEVECKVESDALYIIDKLYTLSCYNLGESDCILGVSIDKFITGLYKFFHDREFQSEEELNDVMLTFLKQLR